MDAELTLSEKNGEISFPVKAVPRSTRNAIGEVREGVLQIRLCAPPVEGKANAALLAFLAEVLGVRKSQVSLKMGEKSRHKVVTVKGLSAEKIRQALKPE